MSEETTNVQAPQEHHSADTGLAVPSRPVTAHTASPASSRPNSARRKSWLPANTRDPVVRDNWFSEVLLVLTSLDKHLASGFDTTYPSALSGHCKESVWAEFIKDINRAAKLKRKHRFALVFKPMVSKVRIIRQAIDAHLDKRTKPMLIMLKYWQDILKSYGLRAELRKGGKSIDKRVPAPSANITRRDSDLFSSSDSTISSRRSVYRHSSAAASQIDIPDDSQIRPAFLHSNMSRASLASARSLAIEQYDANLSGDWELVIYSVKKRSELRSLYTRSRRYSTLSLTGSMKAGRPTTAYMLGEDHSSPGSARRQSRAKTLSLEELAKLPLPPSRSPFNLPKESTSIETCSPDTKPVDLETTGTTESAIDQTNADVAQTTTKEPQDETSKAKKRQSARFPSKDKIQFAVPPPMPDVKGPIPATKEAQITSAIIADSTTVVHNTPEIAQPIQREPVQLKDEVVPKSAKSRNSSVPRVTPSRSPLSAMAITAEHLASDLDDLAESSNKQGNLAMNNRFSVANFLSLASSVLPKTSNGVASSPEKPTSTTTTIVTEGESKRVDAQRDQPDLTVQKTAQRTRSSSFLTVVTPLGNQLEPDGTTVRVVTTPLTTDEQRCEVRTSKMQIQAA